PLEQTRRFSTGQSNQKVVRIQVCQGEARVFADNEPLGQLVLDELREAPRGKVEIKVTFEVDTNGILQVSAIDTETQRTQKARVQLLGTVDASEIEALRARQDQLPEVSGL
ncbi:MAG: Hsp70 family protein, partial [Deltaproteobacteria bacterium]|nr:Hsp70 family protein [Deltaproteobacteria bacterium]